MLGRAVFAREAVYIRDVERAATEESGGELAILAVVRRAMFTSLIDCTMRSQATR